TRTELRPDVGLSDTGHLLPRTSAATVIDPPLLVSTDVPSRIPQYTVEIRDTKRQELVTAIEVLSPTNKRGDGRLEYLARRMRILSSTAHLVEIDLLRAGQRVPAKPALPDVPYFALV